MRGARVLGRIYGVLVRFYPRRFRAEFGAEMRAVFADAVAETAARGWIPLAGLCLRELRDWPGAVLRAHWLTLREEMKVGEGIVMSSDEMERSAFWGKTLLALGPLLLYPVLSLLGLIFAPFLANLSDPNVALGIMFAVIGACLIALVAGWVKRFPRWVFPYWGFALVVTLYMDGFTGTVAGYRVRGDWWVWAPLGGVALLGLLWTRSVEPVLTLLKSIWRDWTLLSFVLYGALPLLFASAYDEVRSAYVAISLLALVQAIGAIFYMRAKGIWRRFALLIGGYSLTWLGLMIHQAIYWNGRQEVWMSEPGSWVETLQWLSPIGATLLAILAAPMLIGVLREAMKLTRLPGSGDQAERIEGV